MKIRYTKRIFGKERMIEIRETKNGYPSKKAWREFMSATKDGLWWVKATDDKGGD